MNRFLLALALCLFSIALAKSQNLEEEIEFNYIKAKYLLDTERYEDAIKAFTKIVDENSSYKDALLLRAKAKYAMAAYKGTKKDVLLFAVSNGMNDLAITLLGKADYKMGKTDAAINSLSVAVAVNKDDAQVSEFLGNIYEKKDQLLKACEYWQQSARMGSSKAGVKARKMCGSEIAEVENVKKKKTRSKIDDPKFPKTDRNEEKKDDEKAETRVMKDDSEATGDQKDDSLNNPTRDSVLEKNERKQNSEDDKKTEEVDDNPNDVDENNEEEDAAIENQYEDLPPDDNTPNEIVIDEDLTLIIRGQGLGKRKILDQPNILILSDEDGIVAVDICVNKRGKVETAEFNSKLSTIAKKSLVSLAIRKSKDFWFEKNDYKEQCGVIMFKIIGS